MKMAAVLQSPAGDAMAWRHDSFSSARDYTLELSQTDRAQIKGTLALIAQRGALAAPTALTSADFAWGALGQRLTGAFEQVKNGRGFALIRGLPVDGVDLQEFIAAVWGVGTYFGAPLSQNTDGELIGHVIDASKQDATPRMYRSNLELRLHSDMTAMISLACWQKSLSGGASVLTSGVTVHDEISRRAPHLLEPLYRGFHYHRLGEEGPGEEPVTPYRMPVFARVGGQLSCRYQRAGIAAGHAGLGVPLTEVELQAMDLFDEVAKAPENRLAFFLARGDMLVVNNYTVMHARTRFEEYPEPEKRRHLIRLWLDAPNFRQVPREISLFAVNGIPPQAGRRCTYDFKKLYGENPRASGGVPNMGIDETEIAR
jgi:hypothetical protein